jgi:hypothetical protein
MDFVTIEVDGDFFITVIPSQINCVALSNNNIKIYLHNSSIPVEHTFNDSFNAVTAFNKIKTAINENTI